MAIANCDVKALARLCKEAKELAEKAELFIGIDEGQEAAPTLSLRSIPRLNFLYYLVLDEAQACSPEWVAGQVANSQEAVNGNWVARSYVELALKIGREVWRALLIGSVGREAYCPLPGKPRFSMDGKFVDPELVADNWPNVRRMLAGIERFDLDRLKLQIDKECQRCIDRVAADGEGRPLKSGKARAKGRSKAGRKPDTDAKSDQRIYEVKQQHRTHDDCAKTLGITARQSKLACDRHRKRLLSSTKGKPRKKRVKRS